METPINQQVLENVLRDYFQSDYKTSLPLVILSKPYSGRTSIIARIAKECGISGKLYNPQIKSHCPCICNETYESKDSSYNFDSWLLSKLNEESLNSCYTVIEISPNEFISIDYSSLFGDCCNGYIPLGQGFTRFLRSSTFNLVPYFPRVQDWINWAKSSGKIDTVVIEFACKYQVCYEIAYDFYMMLNDRLKELLAIANPDNKTKDIIQALFISYELYTKEWVEHAEEHIKMIGYVGFTMRIGSILCEIFIQHLKTTKYAYLFEVK